MSHLKRRQGLSGFGGSWRLALSLMLVVVAAACRTTRSVPGPPAAPPAQPCTTERTLLVRNEVGRDVDVYHITGSTQRFLGTVSQGQTELKLPEGIPDQSNFQGRYSPNGQWIAAAFGGRNAARRLSFEIRCR